VVVGSGPNGLAAAITLAREGRAVLVLEAADDAGGGTRSAELTLPGFVHDVCSAVHPLALGSPFFRTIPWASLGLEWIHPPLALAHPLDDGTAPTLQRSLDATASGLGGDGPAYRRLISPLVNEWDRLADSLLGPLRIPRHPFQMARFGLLGLRSARGLADARFHGEPARALFAGVAAHSILPLEKPVTAAAGLMLSALAHIVGWPIPRGGAGRIAACLVDYLRTLGGELVTGARVDSLDALPPARATLLDVTPRQLLRMAGHRLSSPYRRALARYRYGPGVFKVDLALDGPIPWRSLECARAGTIHLGGSLSEIAASEAAVWRGTHPDSPFVLLAQSSLFDSTRAPEGRHTVWAYCHVPHASTVDMTARIEAQIERFAPGFRDRILARCTRGPAELERRNPNHVGGDIVGGVQDLRQLFTRPVVRLNPYATSVLGLYLCSSSTPPGGGVHGMCGFNAARAALRAGF
jgi:phytoene dehydrogenase-like protein